MKMAGAGGQSGHGKTGTTDGHALPNELSALSYENKTHRDICQ